MPPGAAPAAAVDPFEKFLRQADQVVKDARFVADSVPNVEPFAVERALQRLQAVHHILATTQDPWLKPGEMQKLLDGIIALGQGLEDFLTAAPPPPHIGTTTLPSTGGRPRYDLDLERALELHDMGNSWEDVADALGVARSTLSDHLIRAGLSSGRPQYTEIVDEELDARVAEISMNHPFAGGGIVRGHLEAKGIHVTKERVHDSLRRVDALGTLARCVLFGEA